jgi:hypothetical protein
MAFRINGVTEVEDKGGFPAVVVVAAGETERRWVLELGL